LLARCFRCSSSLPCLSISFYGAILLLLHGE
jgi:hypothetical protein